MGYLVGKKSERPALLGGTVHGEFCEISVTASARRGGVGRHLVTAATEWFREEGASLLKVGYASANPMSVPFWQSFGFQPYMIEAMMPLPPGDKHV